MKILFIQPAVGHKGGGATYPKTWIMEPLALAVLSALTPRRIERMFMDDRLGEVDYSVEADVVAMPAIPRPAVTKTARIFARRGRR